MPFKDPEKRKEYLRQYRLKNKEKLLQQTKEYRIKNKDKIVKIGQKYRKTPQGKKSHRLTGWKHIGVLCFDYDLLYELYINTTHCEYCNCKLTENTKRKATTRCLDHDHSITDRFNVRGVLCNSCNLKDVLK